MKLDNSLVVNEVYGPTIQGEGPYAGARCSFIRLMGCNLSCSWCDTPYTWDSSRFDLHAEGKRRDVDEIAAQAAKAAPLVILTGGEPLLHQKQKGWAKLLAALTHHKAWVHVETNGTRLPTPLSRAAIRHFSVSPKIDNSEQDLQVRERPRVITAFTEMAAIGQACFKFVCATRADIAEVQDWQDRFNVDPSYIWIMPEGTTADTLLTHTRAIIEPAIAAGFNVSSRLHVLAWDNERGV